MAVKGWPEGAHGDGTVLCLDGVASLQEATRMIQSQNTHTYTRVHAKRVTSEDGLCIVPMSTSWLCYCTTVIQDDSTGGHEESMGLLRIFLCNSL